MNHLRTAITVLGILLTSLLAHAASAPVTHNSQLAFATTTVATIMADNYHLPNVSTGTSDMAGAEVTGNGLAPVLVISMPFMSEPLARRIMHDGLLKVARAWHFTAVRFMEVGGDSGVWQYNTTTGAAQVGVSDCNIVKDDHCTYYLSAGLAL